MKKIAIIGGGNMGTAILSRIRRKYPVQVCEASAERRDYLKKTFKVKAADLSAAVKACDIIILAVKPQDFDSILGQIKSIVNAKKLIISIAAGISTYYIENQLGQKVRVVRTMPNMPAQIGEGITAVSQGRYATDFDVKQVCHIFNSIGQTLVVAENLIDAITAVSGSGPAYVFLFAECLMKAAQSLGLNEEQSRELVYKTLTGSVHLLVSSKDDAVTLRGKVTSRGGTTQAATEVFMASNLENIFKEALAAAKQRAKELSK